MRPGEPVRLGPNPTKALECNAASARVAARLPLRRLWPLRLARCRAGKISLGPFFVVPHAGGTGRSLVGATTGGTVWIAPRSRLALHARTWAQVRSGARRRAD